MASKLIKKIQDTAERLYDLRREINAREEDFRKAIEVMKLERDSIQEVLIAGMTKNGLSSLKVSSGDSIFKASRKGVDITNELLAFDWAIKNKAVSINKTIVAQILKDAKDIPKGFELVESEYIGVRKAQVEKS